MLTALVSKLAVVTLPNWLSTVNGLSREGLQWRSPGDRPSVPAVCVAPICCVRNYAFSEDQPIGNLIALDEDNVIKLMRHRRNDDTCGAVVCRRTQGSLR